MRAHWRENMNPKRKSRMYWILYRRNSSQVRMNRFIVHWDCLPMLSWEIHSVVCVFPRHLMWNNHVVNHSYVSMVVIYPFALFVLPKNPLKFNRSSTIFNILLSLPVRFLLLWDSLQHHRHHRYPLVDTIPVDSKHNVCTKWSSWGRKSFRQDFLHWDFVVLLIRFSSMLNLDRVISLSLSVFQVYTFVNIHRIIYDSFP